MAKETRKPHNKVKHSDKIKVATLAEYDLSGQIRATARTFGVPPTTLTSWIRERENGTLDVVDLEKRVEHTKRALINKSVTIMDKALDVIDRKLDACSAPQAATVYGILHDKVQVMQGQVNSNNSGITINNYINNMAEDEASKLMSKALERMKSKAIDVEPVNDD